VCGNLPWRGQPRVGLGAACRPTYAAAIEKAFLEWSQATVFVGVQMAFNRMRTYESAEQVTTFEDHALFYSARPHDWTRVPFLNSIAIRPIPGEGDSVSPDIFPPGLPETDSRQSEAQRHETIHETRHETTRHEAQPEASKQRTLAIVAIPSALQRIDEAVSKLNRHNLSVLAIDVTIPEVRDLGVHVHRVLVPGLVSVNPDHRWPYLGGSAALSKLRFPRLNSLVAFPSHFPHPLG
jgi:ribosomal protein S12 methylthiotransferase accessory factor